VSTDSSPHEAEQPTIVVGVDGSDANAGALHWAADEARRRGARLCLVSAVTEELRTHADTFFSGPDFDHEVAASLASTRELLGQPPNEGLEVDTQVVVGHAATALASASRDASLLVLGRRGRGVFTRLLLGSVSASAACRSTVPAVVVPGSWLPQDHAGDPVVVGVDGSRANEEALRFAFEFALAHAVPLNAVHVSDTVEVSSWAPSEMAADPVWRKVATERLDRAISPWCDAYPAVSVSRTVRQGHPVAELLDAAADAQAIVVGGRPHRRLPAEMLGSVTLGVLDHADRPVVVAHGRHTG
jgi:nucleotide-binding universal stress UspA family protein